LATTSVDVEFVSGLSKKGRGSDTLFAAMRSTPEAAGVIVRSFRVRLALTRTLLGLFKLFED
jgi:hypothetical protein